MTRPHLPSPSVTRRVPGRRLAILVFVVLIAAAGCASEPPTTQGEVVGDSLNGLSALVQLLRDRGHTVTARPEITASAFGKQEAVIVFVDGNGPVDVAAATQLERFLARSGPQWLLLVGRDGDWGVDYWRFVADRADLKDAQCQRAREQGLDAARRLDAWYDDVPTTTAIVPFSAASLVVRGEASGDDGLRVTMRSPADDGEGGVRPGRWPWRRGVMPGEADRVEWEIDGEAYLVRSVDDLEGDTILVIGSDMPLLNAGLVDRGNRQIAEAVVGLLPEGATVVLFGSARPKSDGEDEEENAGGLWRLMSVPPNPWIAAQIFLALLLFCWSRAPIFGRSRLRPASAVRDFGHHVDALGRLLAKGGDPASSAALLAEWERIGRPGLVSGGSEQADIGKQNIQPEARKP